MLVISCGMMRSGSTLQYQLAVELLQRAGRGEGIGEVRHTICQDLEAQTHGQTHVVKVHKRQLLDGVPAAIADGYATGLYISRDIRDVAVSLMNMRQISFERLIFRSGEVQQALRDYEAWTALPQMLISQYEVMMADLTHEVQRIAAHLQIDISPETAAEIADQYDLKRQKQRIQAWKSDPSYDASQHDPNTLLHHNHIRSGETQQWRSVLTPMQIAYLEYIAGDWLRSQNYELSQPQWRQSLSRLFFLKEKVRRKWYSLSRRWTSKSAVSPNARI